MLVEQNRNAQIFHLDGKIDAITSPLLEKIICEKITPDNNKILLDFRDVSYISSAGIRLLLILTRGVRDLAGKLIIYNLNKTVWEIIKITQLDHYLEAADTEEEAFALLEAK